MTRDEFFKARAIAHHVKEHGVTKLPPGEIPEVAPAVRIRGHRSRLANVGQRMLGHAHDRDGNAEPVRAGGSMRNTPWTKR